MAEPTEGTPEQVKLVRRKEPAPPATPSVVDRLLNMGVVAPSARLPRRMMMSHEAAQHLRRVSRLALYSSFIVGHGGEFGHGTIGLFTQGLGQPVPTIGGASIPRASELYTNLHTTGGALPMHQRFQYSGIRFVTSEPPTVSIYNFLSTISVTMRMSSMQTMIGPAVAAFDNPLAFSGVLEGGQDFRMQLQIEAGASRIQEQLRMPPGPRDMIVWLFLEGEFSERI